ncbi:MAG TPA: glycosyltransferase [Candidatus Binatia bacterium]|nr:glycosyltransferase [Candidatus Binatia bacterium]
MHDASRLQRPIEVEVAPGPVPVRVLSWDPVCERSVCIARRLGVEFEVIHYFGYRRPSLAAIKYPLQLRKTLALLRGEGPLTVFISNPPPFAALAVYLAGLRRPGLRYVMDVHTGPFLEPKWRPFIPLTRFLARRSLATVVTNEALAERVRGWGAPAFVLRNPLSQIPQGRPWGRPEAAEKFVVTAICSFYEDEPIDELLRVADLPADVHVYVTGDSRKMRHGLRRALSPQVTLTGFVSNDDFAALLRRSDAVVCLCRRPHTLLQGAVEAAAVGAALVTSESVAMREVFTRGTVYVENHATSIEAGIRQARARSTQLRAEMRQLASAMRADWEAEFRKLWAVMVAERAIVPPLTKNRGA